MIRPMSSVVEIDQPGPSGLSGSVTADRRDDVFASTNEDKKQIVELSDKFDRMQASELSLQPVADVYCSVGAVISCSEKADSIGLNQCPSRGTEVQTNISATCTVYASQKASDALKEGIRSSVQEILSNVPKIIINSVPDHCPSRDLTDAFKRLCEPSHLPFKYTQYGKVVERRRRRDYFKPYCLLSRTQYACQPLNTRRRKYGVSHHQKSNTEPGVNELTQLLEKLATADDKKMGTASINSVQQKWQYSPPPKSYNIRCRPRTKLAQIKERSRSLNDLGMQGLQISTPPSATDLPSSTLNSSYSKTGSSAPAGNSGTPISHVVSGFSKLHMGE